MLAYAAGGLDEGLSVVVATHLSACLACREAVRVCEAVGGQMMAALEAAPMAPDALSRALSRLDSPIAAPALPLPIPVAIGFPLPHPLLAYQLGRWHWIAPGIRHIRILPRHAGRSGLYLLRISPGTAMPEHGHEGNELSCILTGSYTDETGQFRPGDLAEMDPDLEHTPVADFGEDCVCLIATDAKLRFRSLLPRLLQPILGF